MTLSLTQTVTAIGPNLQASFLAIGGTSPYVYSVLPDGAGGTIDPDSGVYIAPATVSSDPVTLYDTVLVTDDDAATADATILVGSPLLLLCDIIQHELGLANGRVYVFDQKINQPKDSDLYVIVSVAGSKPFSNNNPYASNGSGLDSRQYTNWQDRIDIDVISRGPAARDRKAEVILALNSTYAQQQQEINSFYISKVSTAFINLSDIDGAAIPYRFKASVVLIYSVYKTTAIQSFNSFTDEIITDP